MNKLGRFVGSTLTGLALLTLAACATFYKNEEPTINSIDSDESFRVEVCNVSELYAKITLTLVPKDTWQRHFSVPNYFFETDGTYKHDTAFTRCLWAQADKEAGSHLKDYLGVPVKYSLTEFEIGAIGFNNKVITKRYSFSSLGI